MCMISLFSSAELSVLESNIGDIQVSVFDDDFSKTQNMCTIFNLSNVFSST